MQKLSDLAKYSEFLGDALINQMRNSVRAGLADNPGNEAEAQFQLYLAWMSGALCAAVNAAARIDGNGRPEVMRDCMAEIGELIVKHYPSVPPAKYVAISHLASN